MHALIACHFHGRNRNYGKSDVLCSTCFVVNKKVNCKTLLKKLAVISRANPLTATPSLTLLCKQKVRLDPSLVMEIVQSV